MSMNQDESTNLQALLHFSYLPLRDPAQSRRSLHGLQNDLPSPFAVRGGLGAGLKEA